MRKLLLASGFLFVLFAGDLASLSLFATEYLVSEQVAPDSANELLTPLDGFSDEVVDTTERGFVGREIGSYFPVLSGMFSESVLTLAPRFYYFHSSTDGAIREEAAHGGSMTLVTGWWEDSLRLGFSGATSQALFTPEGRGGTGLLQDGGTGYWAPGEAYGEIRIENLFHATLFRQEMNLPYFNRNDTRMTPRVHEVYKMTTNGDPHFLAGAAHITRVKSRTGEDFLPMSEAAGASGSNRGVTLAGFRYQWREEKSDIGALNGIGWDTFNTFYTESTHRWDLPRDFEFNLSGQFANQQSLGKELLGAISTSTIGARAALSYEGLVARLSFTSTSEGGRI
ncbi:MAG: OprD family outer membrane porin [Verrucomicrobiales bacterium]|nr:OprD family outer membrane porin [Verrucomicrobiales bacterium]MDF2378542.1 OprD family outer membrane porin [Verrucomicrobiales bacterium]